MSKDWNRARRLAFSDLTVVMLSGIIAVEKFSDGGWPLGAVFTVLGLTQAVLAYWDLQTLKSWPRDR